MNYLDAFTELKDKILNYTTSRHFQPMTGAQWLEEWVYEQGKKKGQHAKEMYEECTITSEGIVNDEGMLVYKIIPYKFIIFDVDGTLVKTKSGETFRKTADDWEMLPGRVEKCDELSEQGVLLGIASNQAGVAFPWSKFTEAEIRTELTLTSLMIDGCYTGVCCSSPHEKALPEYFNADDPRRKPNGGMIAEGMKHVGVEAEDTLFVGDRDEDEKAAKAAGVAFQWAWQFFGDEKPE